MVPTRLFYLVLLSLGLVFPVRRLAQWITENGYDPAAFVASVRVNPASLAMADTVFLVAAAAIVFMVSEAIARHDLLSLIAVPATLLLGPAVGLPLYLFLRLRSLD